MVTSGERAEPAEEDVERAAGCPPGALADTVARLASVLGGDTGAISALRILHLYMERLGCDFQARPFYLQSCRAPALPNGCRFLGSITVTICLFLDRPICGTQCLLGTYLEAWMGQ